MAKKPISDFTRKTANRLRANTTTAEQILWRHLRRLDVKGSHFRRQVASDRTLPISPVWQSG
jgi:very-short-patch-repair endonuclease